MTSTRSTVTGAPCTAAPAMPSRIGCGRGQTLRDHEPVHLPVAESIGERAGQRRVDRGVDGLLPPTDVDPEREIQGVENPAERAERRVTLVPLDGGDSPLCHAGASCQLGLGQPGRVPVP